MNYLFIMPETSSYNNICNLCKEFLIFLLLCERLKIQQQKLFLLLKDPVVLLWKHQVRKDKRAVPSQSLHTVLWIVNFSFQFQITLFWATLNISQTAAVCFALLQAQALTMIQGAEIYAFSFLCLNNISKKIHII